MIQRVARRWAAGMTFTSFLFVMAIVVAVVLLGLRLMPAYINHAKVKSILQDLSTEVAITDRSVHEIRNLLDRRFEVNSVDRVRGKDIQIEKGHRQFTAKLQYEVREHIVGNIDAIIMFDETVKVGSP
ncbi:MAG: DUF4845 domain-containing protein [Chromatiales bacterium]|nr:DUF4845 domain-containing protein [Chromatiales bacterium]